MSDGAARVGEILRAARPRVVAALVRSAGGIDAAEDAFQEAALAAVARWPTSGVPDTPAAWLTTAAKNHVRDRRRRAAVADAKAPLLAEEEAVDLDAHDGPSDALLRLLFTCCHPVLAREAQVALTLKVVAGFSTEEIARAFLVTEPTMAQRIVRAKRALEGGRVPYDVPERSELPARLASVLDVIYLAFNEGFVASEGALMRIDLQAEALHLGRALADLLPNEPEVFGLLALMALAAARAETRVDAEGLPRLLADQDRTRWRGALVEEGVRALVRARRLGPPGAYVLQAEISACHVSAPRWEDTDWPRIVAAYDALLALTRSPVVALNRAIAVSMIEGPESALALLPALEAPLARYHLFYATRAELLDQTGRDPRPDLARALSLATNDAERALLQRRLA